jgi:hypothetical protein
MNRYAPYSRREFRARFHSWAWRNWKAILACAMAVVVFGAVEGYLLLVVGESAAWKLYVLGVLHATAISVLLLAVMSTFLAHDRKAIVHLRGAWGEELTRAELKRARRRKLIWGWVDSVTLESGDIDHLVVTRSGGLIVIDSKWRNQASSVEQMSMAQSARKARLRAEGVMQTLFKRERGAHRAQVNPLAVRPLVVVWGAIKNDIPKDARAEGVEVVSGAELVPWLSTVAGSAVSADASKDLLRRLESFRATTWSATSRSAS